MNRKQAIRYGLTIVAISLLAYVLRFCAVHMYDLHIDEITYGHFAQTIDAGELPRDFNGQAFFLHPPGYFVLLAIWRAIFWHGGNLFSQYTVLRGLNILLGGISVGFVVAITNFLSKSKRLGYWAGLLFALDPFLIRQNTRGLMETATMLFLLIGLWLFLRYAERPATERRLWFGIGLVFGLAIITKDVALNFLVLAFALMAIRKVGPPRRTFRYIFPGAMLPYAVWLAIVAISGYTVQFFDQKTVGVRRFLGLVQITGFNAANAPSKNGTLLQTIPHYASSYAIMGLGTLAACWLLTSRNANRRRWGCISTAAALVVAYLYIGGTFEEQYLYYLMVPSIISLVVGALEIWYRVPVIYCVLLRRLALVGVASLLAFGIVSYSINIKAAPANGWQKTITWVDGHAPANSTVCTYGQGQFLFGGSTYNICDYVTLSDMDSHNVQYVVVSEKLTDSGYEPVSVKLFKELEKQGTVAYRYTSPDSGTFDVIKLNGPAAAPDNVRPPTAVASASSKKPAVKANSIPALAATPVGVSVATDTPNTAQGPTELVNTGTPTGTAALVFGLSAAAGTSLAYLFLYLKNRRLYQPQFWDLDQRHQTGGEG